MKDLARPYFIPGTEQIDISEWIPFEGQIRLDFEKTPYTIYRELNGLQKSEASQEELLAIENGLKNLPLLRPHMYRFEIHGLFTDQEKTIIRSVTPTFVELLLMADEPVSTKRLVPFLTELYENKVISFERFYQLTGIR